MSPPELPAGTSTPAECEAWFEAHGLPWFVASVDARLARLLRPAAIARLVAGVLGLGLAAGIPLGLAAGDLLAGVVVAVLVMLVVLVLFVATVLRGTVIARWAIRRTLSELGVMFPLVTRALPLLLLFTTFLFINTEVWQVASSLSRSVLWSAVLLFAGVAVAFLLVRLPEELRIETRRIAERDGGDPALTVRQQGNLLLVLLVSQALQVLLLSTAVFLFFAVFGLVAIDDEVVRSWIGEDPSTRVWTVAGERLPLPISDQLFQVSVFLAAFSGLYFTVYAVSDQTYREQFFTRISRQLEDALTVQAHYLRTR